jgi:catechol 2,3-dioxygenase-like lactoylglutathione lyase family enzyme
MIAGAHFLFYTADPDADRAFFRDVLGFASVDAGDGWLIFALPPAELAVHPSDGNFVQQHAGHSLQRRGVACAPIADAPWGRYTVVRLPSGGEIGLYQPTHATAIGHP